MWCVILQCGLSYSSSVILQYSVSYSSVFVKIDTEKSPKQQLNVHLVVVHETNLVFYITYHFPNKYKHETVLFVDPTLVAAVHGVHVHTGG